jgi:hypothetical protein
MLAHLSKKFQQGESQRTHEPRAGLFLNRFTRTLTIMYATNGVQEILGISGEEMKGHSFYYCIQENCLEDAVRCMETAKGNDSIAYLRFLFRDPRLGNPTNSLDGTETEAIDEDMDAMSASSDDDDDDEGGVLVGEPMDETDGWRRDSSFSDSRSASLGDNARLDIRRDGSSAGNSSRDSGLADHSDAAIFGESREQDSSNTSASPPPSAREYRNREPIELEAVVSCSSDGLVVILRRARPAVPIGATSTNQPTYTNGLFAAPWGTQPIIPRTYPAQQNEFARQSLRHSPAFPGPPVAAPPPAAYAMPDLQAHPDVMTSIREVAVFAWALTGINGNLERFSRGKPMGESQPPGGMPVWTPQGENDHIDYTRNDNLHMHQSSESTHQFHNGYHATVEAVHGAGQPVRRVYHNGTAHPQDRRHMNQN